MLNAKTLSILAIAGSAAALPQWGNWGAGKYFSGNRGDGDNAAATALEIVTAYVTVTYTGGWNGNYGGGYHTSAVATSAVATSTVAPAPAPVASSPAPVAPAPSSSSSSSPAPVVTYPPSTSVAPSTTSSAPVASSSAPSSGSGDDTSSDAYMAIVNKWRAKMSMSDLTFSTTLQGNALKTVTDSNGQMVHELNPGSFAQVLAPGNANNFENVFVGGWLCERPDLPGLNGICTTMSQGWAYDGQTGHADILTSTAYSKIGCALYAGIWGCDLA